MRLLGVLHRPVKSFALGRTEVTQGQWRALMGSNPSKFKTCGDDCPVEQVSWNDAQAYVRKLSELTGKAYRLPSESEWEYACRAGTKDRYCGGSDIAALAWYRENSGGSTHPVGGKQGNAWGLFDMSGNVNEWTQDCAADDYVSAPADGSASQGESCRERVLRSGSRGGAPGDVRAAARVGSPADWRISSNGFRVVREVP